MISPQLTDGCPSSISNNKKYLSNDGKENSLDSSARESVKSEKSCKSEGNCRRRTIIVEKKSGTYGFTLQSYGIHYKKDQEIEIITYVDYVEVEGPAAAAGMREGDVILAINGADVERADHAYIVNAINACDSRMRMVVIFEDCVRKVELHLKYINLQRALQSKMRKLEQLIVHERAVFDTNWKSNSLPSQKKKLPPSDVISENEGHNVGDNINGTYCRPTASSENVAAAKSPQTSIFMYQYRNLRYGDCVVQPNIRKGSFVITVDSTRNKKDCYHYTVKNVTDNYHRDSESKSCDNRGKQTYRTFYSHTSAPSMPKHNIQDVNGLDAYDLATPCCHPHCLPNIRKKVRREEECSKEHKENEKYQSEDKATHSKPKKICSSRYRFLTTESNRTSQCSIESYATSNATVQFNNNNSASSHSTSLSSDTLLWDKDRCEAKLLPRIKYQTRQQHIKLKSWDNLMTKAFGGYGFGYGYLESSAKQTKRTKSQGRSQSGRSTQSQHVHHLEVQEKHWHSENSGLVQHYSENGSCYSHWAPTKSTESLIVVPKFQLVTSSSETCRCAEFIEKNRNVGANKSAANHYCSYFSQHLTYPSLSYKQKDSNVSSEITRL